jgi:hypothetical protein
MLNISGDEENITRTTSDTFAGANKISVTLRHDRAYRACGSCGSGIGTCISVPAPWRSIPRICDRYLARLRSGEGNQHGMSILLSLNYPAVGSAEESL